MLSAAFTGFAGLALASGVVLATLIAGLRSVGAPRAAYMRAPLAVLAVVPIALLVSALTAALLGHGGLGSLRYLEPLLVAIALPLGGYLAGRRLGGGRTSAVRRGAQVLSDSAAARVRERLAHRSVRDALRIAGVPVPATDESKHFKLVGTTGTGKTTAICELLAGAIARGDRAVLADPDGGYLERFYDPRRGDVILNPFHARAHRWDLFGEVEQPYHIEQLARALIPDTGGAAQEWVVYARTFFAAVMHRLHAGRVTDLSELYRVLMLAGTNELRGLLDATAAQPFLEESNLRMFGSVRAVTAAALASLEYLRTQVGEPLAVRRWVRSGAGVLFLPYGAEQIAALRAVISSWMRLAIFQTLSLQRPGDGQRLWFVVDELDALGPIDGLKDALVRLRKFGGRCVLGFQSLAQVSSTYGHGEAQTIVENCGNTLILRCSASEGGGTARFASQLVGEREVLLPQVSRTRSARPFDRGGSTVSRSTERRTEAALLAAEIEQLPDFTGYLKLASEPAWLRVRLAPP